MERCRHACGLPHRDHWRPGPGPAIVFGTGVVRLGATPQCSEGGSRPGEGPLGGGTTTTLANAQSTARFPVLTPAVSAASLSNLTQVWVNKQRNVALVFRHGKVMITFAPAIYNDALKEFQRFIAQNHVTAAIGHVHRHPALVITPHTDGCGSNPAWVEFKRGRIDISIYSGATTPARCYPSPTALCPGHLTQA